MIKYQCLQAWCRIEYTDRTAPYIWVDHVLGEAYAGTACLQDDTTHIECQQYSSPACSQAEQDQKWKARPSLGFW